MKKKLPHRKTVQRDTFPRTTAFFNWVTYAVERSKALALRLKELLGAFKGLSSELAFWAFLLIELERFGRFLLVH